MVQAHDPLMVELCKKLPEPGTYWPLDARMAWLQACESVFNLIYGREPQAIFIDASKIDPADIERLKSQAGGAAMVMLDTFPKAEAPEPPKVDPPKQVRPDRQAPHPRVGARRPEGIPTTFTMVQTILKEATEKLTAHGVMEEIEKRWWPGLGRTFLGPDISSFITMGRLTRNPLGQLSLTEKGATMVSADLRHSTKGEFQTPAPEPKPTVPEAVKAIVEEVPTPPKLPVKREIAIALPKKVVVAPQPTPRSPVHPIKFDHNDKTTYLATTREFVIASKLRNAMGKGHVGEAYLASEVLGSNTEINRDVIRLACRGMNESLAAVGLKIEHFEGYGLLMQEVG